MSGTIAVGLYSYSVYDVDVAKESSFRPPQLDPPALTGTAEPVISALTRRKDPEPKLCRELSSTTADTLSSSSTGSGSFHPASALVLTTSWRHGWMDGWIKFIQKGGKAANDFLGCGDICELSLLLPFMFSFFPFQLV